MHRTRHLYFISAAHIARHAQQTIRCPKSHLVLRPYKKSGACDWRARPQYVLPSLCAPQLPPWTYQRSTHQSTSSRRACIFPKCLPVPAALPQLRSCHRQCVQRKSPACLASTWLESSPKFLGLESCRLERVYRRPSIRWILADHLDC